MAVPLSGAPARPSEVTAAIAAALGSQQIGELIAYDEQTSDSSTFTSETVIGSVTFTAIQGYTYLIECIVQLASGTVTDIVQGTLREDSISGTEVDSGRAPAQTSDQARPVGIDLAKRWVAPSSGSKTFVVTGQRVSGGGNVKREAGTTHPQLLSVTLRKKT